MKIIKNNLIMMFNILSFFNVRNIKDYLNNNNKIQDKNISDQNFNISLRS